MAYQRGSGFVGLQQYLNANRQQGAALGSSVAGSVEQGEQQAMAMGQQDLNALRSGVSAGTLQYQPVDNFEALARVASGAYTGPATFSPSATKEAATKAGQRSALAGTDAGVATLLQQQYGQGYTGVGGRSLDAALARRGAGERLDAAGRGVERMRAYLGNLQTQGDEAIAGGKATTDATLQQYGQQLSNAPRYDVPGTVGNDTRRNRIQTPGTMPDKPSRRDNPLNRIGRLLTGGNY